MRPQDRPSPDVVVQPPLRILIADDNEDAADVLRMILGSKGHEVRVVHDGREAVASAEAWKPDVALLDIGLPELDGLQVAEQIRTQRGDSVMLVAISGWSPPAAGTPEAEARPFARFDRHLVKPVDLEALAACLSEWQRVRR